MDQTFTVVIATMNREAEESNSFWPTVLLVRISIARVRLIIADRAEAQRDTFRTIVESSENRRSVKRGRPRHFNKTYVPSFEALEDWA